MHRCRQTGAHRRPHAAIPARDVDRGGATGVRKRAADQQVAVGEFEHGVHGAVDTAPELTPGRAGTHRHTSGGDAGNLTERATHHEVAVAEIAADAQSAVGQVCQAVDSAGRKADADRRPLHTVPTGEAQCRAFSIASAPSSAGEIELNIRRVPGGAATGWVHDTLRCGDTVRFSGPYGRFFVRQSQHEAEQLPYLFLAGGSGLSSPRSMILDLLEKGCTRPIALVNGARSQAELYHHSEFVALAAQHAHFSYVPVLSNEPEDSGWTGARGFVHDAAKAHFANDFRGRKAYLCGPPLMIDACITTLMQGRLFERDIYTEKFISAADAQQVRSPLFRKI